MKHNLSFSEALQSVLESTPDNMVFGLSQVGPEAAVIRASVTNGIVDADRFLWVDQPNSAAASKPRIIGSDFRYAEIAGIWLFQKWMIGTDEQVSRSVTVLTALKAADVISNMSVAMILHCPECHVRHIDEGEFAVKLHHTHSCQSCGFTWRPAIVPTVGVQFLPGFKNEVKL